MRKWLPAVVALVWLTGTATAQTQNSQNKAMDKVVRDNVTFTTDVQVGTTLLKAGEYKVRCDGNLISFTTSDSGKKVIEVQCKGKTLEAPAKVTTAELNRDANGVAHLVKLTLRGSDVEHAFD